MESADSESLWTAGERGGVWRGRWIWELVLALVPCSLSETMVAALIERKLMGLALESGDGAVVYKGGVSRILFVYCRFEERWNSFITCRYLT